jgi:hypothetical protein
MILPKDLPWAITMLVFMVLFIFMAGKMINSNHEYWWVYSLLFICLAIVFIVLINHPLL